MAALWAADGALTPERVRSEIGGDLAYTTTATTLVRLLEKGAVARAATGRSYVYWPVLVDEADVTAQRMRRLLAADPDHGGVLRRFVAALDPSDEAALRRALRSEQR